MFKLIFSNNVITYGQQDKVNTVMKQRPDITVFRNNIDDIKFEVLKLQNEHSEAQVVFVGV